MAKAKHIAGIDCEGAAAEAIRVVLLKRFEEMCAFRDKALDWSDPEGVHDMRVSSRRLRGTSRDFTGYLRKRKLSVVMEQIRSVADALGAVRDQDVAIMGLHKLAAGAPPEAAGIVEKLVAAREAIRTEARKNLRQSLHMGHFKQLQKDFEAAMDSATSKSKPTKRQTKDAESHREPTYREVARAIILERLLEVEKFSAGLYRPLKIKPLHRMRIALKRLRYALELFDSCWGTRISIFAKRVAALQSALGELNDSDIWIKTFGEHLNRVEEQAKEGRAGALWLLSHFVSLHSKHLRSTLGKWSEWEANEFGSQLRECVAQDLVLPVPPVSSGRKKGQESDNEASNSQNSAAS